MSHMSPYLSSAANSPNPRSPRGGGGGGGGTYDKTFQRATSPVRYGAGGSTSAGATSPYAPSRTYGGSSSGSRYEGGSTSAQRSPPRSRGSSPTRSSGTSAAVATTSTAGGDAQLSTLSTYPFFERDTKVDVHCYGSHRTLSVDPRTTTLADFVDRVNASFPEGPFGLVYDYGNGKEIALRDDTEFKAALISWPGAPQIAFRAVYAPLLSGDFTEMCLLRLAVSRNRLEDLEHDIKAKYERPGVCLILTMSDMGEVTDAHGVWHTLALVMQQRQICHTIIRQCGGFIVKAEGEKTFVIFDSEADAVTAGIMCMGAVADYNQATHSSESHIYLQIGIDTGDILRIPHDLYGDCVNVASKLGEDAAEAGDFFITTDVYETVRALEPFRGIGFTRGETVQSKVTIPYLAVSGRLPVEVEESISSIALPTTGAGSHRESLFSRLCRERLSRAALGDVSYIDEELDRRYRRHGVVLVSDMSGFTRTVKRRGILHFLTLIMQMRTMVVPRLEAAGGTVVKFEADNLYVVFDNPDLALQASLDSVRALLDHNRGRDEDDHVTICIGMDFGPFVWDVEDEDVFGHARNRAEVLGEDVGSKYEVMITDEFASALTRSYHMSGPLEEEAFGDEPLVYFKVDV